MLWPLFVVSLSPIVAVGQEGTCQNEPDLAGFPDPVHELQSEDAVSMLQNYVQMRGANPALHQKNSLTSAARNSEQHDKATVAVPVASPDVAGEENLQGKVVMDAPGSTPGIIKYNAALELGAEVDERVATSAEPHEMYFRPVSVTLRCVLALTCLFLATYTALAIARNVDELSGRVRASLITETFTVACRSTTYAPMLAALFLACRMYVLQSTDGKSEPQVWAKACMIAATAGLFMEPLIVCLLPLIVKHDREPFAKLSGVACSLDVHPQLFKYGREYDKFFKYAWIGQMVALLPIYGGVGGVIVAIVSFPVKVTVSPAIVATIILAAWYFIVFGILFVARTRQQMSGEQEQTVVICGEPTPLKTPPSSATDLADTVSLERHSDNDEVNIGEDKLLKFALNATYPMDTAAMFAVLFLGARLRAVNLGTEPQIWAQVFFITCAVALPFMSLLNGIAGVSSSERLGYYGEKLYDATNLKLMIAKHVAAGMLYFSLGAVVISIYTLEAAPGMTTAPLSTTLKSLLQLSNMFFVVYALHWLFAATRTFVFKENWVLIMESSVLAARNSVQFCPILAILFVSCRMRALQITQMKGDPQGWAQDAMDVILTAVFIQIVCCLMLPIFTGKSSKTDAEGNAEYDMKPLVGAYIVTCMKYFSLFLIFGGVLVVGSSIFMITPETADSNNTMFDGMVGLIGFLMLFTAMLLIVMVLSSGKVIGLAVKLAVESADRSLLGVDVDVGTAKISLCRGCVNLANVIVHNPEGYKTPYLLSVGRIVVDLDMWKLIKSFGKQIVIEALILQEVDVIFEKNFSSSNVQDLLKHLQGDEKEPTKEVKELEQKKNETETESTKVSKDDAPALQAEVILHLIDIKEIGAKVASTYLGGKGLRVALGNIQYEDFQEKSGGTVKVSEVMRVILETLMKTVLANSGVVGESLTKAGETIRAGVRGVGEKARRAAEWVRGAGPFSPRSSKSKDTWK